MCDCGIRPDFYTVSEPRARKTHNCIECDSDIRIGEKHRCCTGKWDGEVKTYRMCAKCARLFDAVLADLTPYDCPPAFGELGQFASDHADDPRLAA